jgi:hypothetical protein
MSNEIARWTIITYIAAHNNLETAGRRSLDQILGVGSTAQLNLVALYDKPSGAARFIAGKPGHASVEESFREFDSGDPDALLETVRWAVTRCPAHHYGLILWSHGTGWLPEEVSEVARQARGDEAVSEMEATERSAQPSSMALFRTTLARMLKQSNAAERAVCFDDGSGHSLDTLELERVVREIQGFVGQPLDLLGMDACLMASLEVAYQIRQHVRYLVASEEMVPVSSWPYDYIFQALSEAPEMSAEDLTFIVVRHYLDYYTTHPPQFNAGDVTKVALNLARIDEIKQVIDSLARVLLENMEEQAAHLWVAQRQTRRKESSQETRSPTKFGLHLWDLGSLASILAGESRNPDVKQAARSVQAALQPGGAIIAEGHRGDWFDGIGGLSIYAVPPGIQRISPYYGSLALVRNTRWGEMLKAYHQEL